MTSIAKADALAALRACEGDVTSEGLRRAGLPFRKTTALGKILDELGCTTKSGRGNLRKLAVSLEEAIARVDAVDDDVLEAADSDEEDRVPRFAVVHDPHGIYAPCEPISSQYLHVLVRMSRSMYPDINGLEVSDGQVVYRLYRGLIYRLDNGEMIETQV